MKIEFPSRVRIMHSRRIKGKKESGSFLDRLGYIISTIALILFPWHFTLVSTNVSSGDFFVLLWIVLQIFNRKSQVTSIGVFRCYAPWLTAILLSFLYSFTVFPRDFYNLKVFAVELIKAMATIAWVIMVCHESRVASPRRLRVIIGACMAFSVIALSHAIFALVGGSSIRLRWPFTNPNLLGNYCVFCFFTILLGAYIKVNWIRRFKYPLLGLALLGLAASGSRGAFGNIVVGIAFMISASLMLGVRRLTKRKLVQFCVGGALAIIVGLAVFPVIIQSTVVQKRIEQTFQDDGPKNLDIRKLLWEEAMYEFRSSPIFGIGFGQFQIESGRAIGVGPSGLGLVAHNVYVSYLAELGLVGIFAFLFVVFKTEYVVWRLVKRDGEWAPLPAMAFIVGTMAQGLVANTDNYRTFAIAMGLLLAARMNRSSSIIRLPLMPKSVNTDLRDAKRAV